MPAIKPGVIVPRHPGYVTETALQVINGGSARHVTEIKALPVTIERILLSYFPGRYYLHAVKH